MQASFLRSRLHLATSGSTRFGASALSIVRNMATRSTENFQTILLAGITPTDAGRIGRRRISSRVNANYIEGVMRDMPVAIAIFIILLPVPY